MNTILNTKIHSDSGIYQSGEGYERLIMITNWLPSNPGRVARIHIRVDRNPLESYARVESWKDGGWTPIFDLAPNEFWYSMPGYLRWTNDRSVQSTITLARRLVRILGDLVSVGRVRDV